MCRKYRPALLCLQQLPSSFNRCILWKSSATLCYIYRHVCVAFGVAVAKWLKISKQAYVGASLRGSSQIGVSFIPTTWNLHAYVVVVLGMSEYEVAADGLMKCSVLISDLKPKQYSFRVRAFNELFCGEASRTLNVKPSVELIRSAARAAFLEEYNTKVIIHNAMRTLISLSISISSINATKTIFL